MLLSAADTTFTHTPTHTPTVCSSWPFGPCQAHRRVWGVSFVIVMSSSEWCQNGKSQERVDQIEWSTAFQTIDTSRCVFVLLHCWTSLRAHFFYLWHGSQYHKFMVIEMAESFGGNAVNLILQQKRSPYSICTQCHAWCDRETPESKWSYRGLTGFATYPLHKSYLLIAK